MKHIYSFEHYLNEANLIKEEQLAYDMYAKRVGWIMQKSDIHTTSGNINGREKKYNVLAKESLFLNFSTKEDFNNDSVVVPPTVPLLYYGGSQDKESAAFMQNRNINKKNLYNKREILQISGDKTLFAETFGSNEWLPKTVFSRKEAIDGAVGFPVIAKIKNGHSGIGIKKFDTPEELTASTDKFDLFCQYIDFVKEYRVVFCKDKIIIVNERVPTIDDNRSITTKETDERISFTYVYQDQNVIPAEFTDRLHAICKDIKKGLDLDLWSLDVVVDKSGVIYVMETSSATGLGSVKMCEIYKAIYEDFYGENLPDSFLQTIYTRFVVPGHQNYWPKYTKEIESSEWAMDYTILTDPAAQDGYRYFFNLDKK